MKTLTSIPFFRIMIPFVLGIIIGLEYELNKISWIYFTVLFCVIILINQLPAKTRTIKVGLLFLADVFLFVYGLNLVQLNNVSKQETYYGNIIHKDSLVSYLAVIEDLPVEKEKFVKCNLQVLEVKSFNGFKKADGHIIAYFKKAKSTKHLYAGNTLLIKSKFLEIQAPKNPFEFDYKNYLYNKQVYHTAFIDSSAFEILSNSNCLNVIWQLGLNCKAYLLSSLKNSSLTENAYGICAALLTGYDDEIDKSVMQAFSHSGTLHVLSVSGLHTGLIYLVLSFLFDCVDKRKRFKLLKFIFITLVLWFFALITGFSAPVLRAVIMFNLMGLGKIYFRNDYRNQLNLLLVSAFILLNYNPFLLVDIGFLLSYFALFGLIYFQPKLAMNYQPSNVILSKVWQSITASFAATISTLPITLFCFKQFPLWFFVCNILVVPATFVILLLAFVLVLKLHVAAVVINYLVAFLIAFINLFNSASFGFIDNIDFNFLDVIFLSTLLILLSNAFQQKSYRQLVLSVVLLLVWQFNGLLQSYSSKEKNLFTVYHIKKKNVYAVKNKTDVILNKMDLSDFNFHIKPNFISFNHPDVTIKEFNYIKFNKQKILILDKNNFWPAVPFSDITTLVLSNNFNISEKDIQKFQKLQQLVLDASNNNYTTKKIEKLSRKFGFEIYNITNKGAYLLAL